MADDLSKKVERLVKRLEREGRPSPDDGMGGDGNYLEAATLLRTLSTRLAKAEQERDELREWNRQMVEKAASGGTLDGYREMGARLAEAEARNAALVEEAANMAKEIADQYVGYMSRIEKAIRALASDAERDALAERDTRVRAEERERCAQTAEKIAEANAGPVIRGTAQVIAAAIRGDDQ